MSKLSDDDMSTKAEAANYGDLNSDVSEEALEIQILLVVRFVEPIEAKVSVLDM